MNLVVHYGKYGEPVLCRQTRRVHSERGLRYTYDVKELTCERCRQKLVKQLLGKLLMSCLSSPAGEDG